MIRREFQEYLDKLELRSEGKRNIGIYMTEFMNQIHL